MLPVLLSPMYSDSVVERATIGWSLLDHPIAPWLLMKTNPEVDLEVSESPDQSASENPWNVMSKETSDPSKLRARLAISQWPVLPATWVIELQQMNYSRPVITTFDGFKRAAYVDLSKRCKSWNAALCCCGPPKMGFWGLKNYKLGGV